ncbi:MAG: UDP-N-acetylmuramoyl-tripeptide--D-alanyl-D-alanine ligase [Bacteroidales bacterium]|nr:MAG: UDP-N-acetylmuramoyl-tripeptide--D-alanyl-D-alanine ligase [Bacteroidales bacterium]
MEISKLYELYKQHPGISTDSRSVKKNSIFFALKGENFDGNNFAENALKRGAAWAVIDKSGIKADRRFIIVKDSLSTLQSLANYHRKMCSTKLLAITGSNGKTTTKELIRKVLSGKYSVFATQGNLNNHIGVPLTLLSMPPDTQIGIIEMGANHHGEIKQLCAITEPDYGLVTNIGKAHLEGFGNIEDIARAKAELFEYLKNNNGTIFGNAGNSFVNAVIPENHNNKVLYGIENSICWGKSLASDPFLKLILFMSDDPNGVEINTNLFGRYNLENVIAAAALGHFFNISKSIIKQAIESYFPEDNRSQLIEAKSNSIYLDAYNANPTSMRAAIDNFIELNVESKFFILGEMLEVGNTAEKEHRSLLKFLKEKSIKNVLCVGKGFYKHADKYGYKYFSNVDELAKVLKINKIRNANILIKGSRANQLEKLVPYLQVM